MNVVKKAVWFVEAHKRTPLSLEVIADACNVSPFHLTRAFASVTGVSLMRYVRLRRLSEAAERLAGGATDIFDLALDAQYSSHEAFTRAFRDHFGVTPEAIRAQRNLEHIKLQEAIDMSTTVPTELAPPRVENMKPRMLGGLSERHDCNDPRNIPAQWQRFVPMEAAVPGRVEPVDYGVCYDFDKEGNFSYMCAMELSTTDGLPKGLTVLNLPAQRYLVFTHSGHVSGIRNTISSIWSSYLPDSEYTAVEGAMLERYGPEFNPRTGMGGVEIWVPVKI